MSSNLTKKELIELLHCAKNSKERNKAVKLLKKYDPAPCDKWDEQFGKKSCLRVLDDVSYICAFMCPRCGKVKQTKSRVQWTVEQDGKTKKMIICTGCYRQLIESEEIRKLRREHQKEGLVPKGMGFGLSGADVPKN